MNSQCVIDECSRKRKGRGMCVFHYNKWLRSNNRHCTVVGCEKGVVAKDMCSLHWQRFHKHGDPQITKALRHYSVLEFWERVKLTADASRCWLWFGPSDKHGYGIWNMNGQRWSAHRFALYLTKGKELTLNALHKCDNPPCVNPNHLYEGTQSQNMVDSWQRTRRLSK